MAPTTIPMLDPVVESNAMADLFNNFSQAVDQFRLNFKPPLPDDQMGRLKDESQALEDRAHYFTAEAIGATLLAIQSDLANIKSLTTQAQTQLASLTKVDRAITIATSVLSLGAAIAAGDPATIIAAGQALAKTLV